MRLKERTDEDSVVTGLRLCFYNFFLIRFSLEDYTVTRHNDYILLDIMIVLLLDIIIILLLD